MSEPFNKTAYKADLLRPFKGVDYDIAKAFLESVEMIAASFGRKEAMRLYTVAGMLITKSASKETRS